MFPFLVASFLIFPFISSYFESDLKSAVDEYKCKPNCTFNHSELNSTTIEFFPTACYAVCGIITINENTDLSFAKMESIFARISVFAGGLQILNTKLKTLSFLTNGGEIHIRCFPVGAKIMNNSELVDADALYGIYPSMDYNAEYVPIRGCNIQILNNTKLDASGVCDHRNYYSFPNMEVYDNKKDCRCPGGVISAENLTSFQKCRGLFDGLKLSNMTYSSNLSSLENVQFISGNVEIAFTNFSDLSFFKSLFKIKGTLMNSVETVILDIHNNPNLKRLGLESVNTLFVINPSSSGAPTMNLENLHPDFCLTFQEAVSLAYVRFKNLQAKFCNSYELKSDLKSCNFTSLDNLESDCAMIFGNILIDSTNEAHVENLKKANSIFGSLTIQNSNLEDTKFLEHLNHIYYLHESLPVIRISNNTKLKRVAFPSIVTTFARGKKEVIIENNAPGLFRASISCLAFQSNIGANVTYNGKNCKAIDIVNGANLLHRVVWLVLSIFIWSSN